MSNVLIGVIGVILFIGLALAGALILGDDFRASKASTTAALTAQQLQQIAAAANMYQLKTGRILLAANASTNMATLTPRFLQSIPINPVESAGYFTASSNGYANASAGTAAVHHVFTRIGNTSAGRSACRAIEEQAGASDPDAALVSTSDWTGAVASRNRVGCFNYNGYYYPFIPI